MVFGRSYLIVLAILFSEELHYLSVLSNWCVILLHVLYIYCTGVYKTTWKGMYVYG